MREIDRVVVSSLRESPSAGEDQRLAPCRSRGGDPQLDIDRIESQLEGDCGRDAVERCE